jgi:hypothetical protein
MSGPHCQKRKPKIISNLWQETQFELNVISKTETSHLLFVIHVSLIVFCGSDPKFVIIRDKLPSACKIGNLDSKTWLPQFAADAP